MANFLLIFYIASACIDSYASEHNMMRNFKLFLMPALMAYLSFHANHDVLLYIALLLSWAGDVYLINKTKKNYQLGLISFMLAHISYGIYFIHPLPLTSLMFWVGVLLYGIAGCLYLKLMKHYNKNNQIHVLKTSTEISGFAFFSNNPNNFVTLLYTYFSQQNHEILSIFKYFLEAELKS